ncbi:MAG: glycosyltransferase [Candidatus Margulisbacteria bacterium]|nr:glycosyltransferase [Candidatus Margulisiibacteriota bacterium]
MKFFYVNNPIELPINTGLSMETFSFIAPVADQLSADYVPESYVYFSTESDTSHIQLSCKIKYEKEHVVTIDGEKLRRIICHPNFPKDIGHVKARDKLLVPLEAKAKALVNKPAIRVAIVNGMGTGSGDSLLGLKALEIFYERLKKLYSEVEIDVFQLLIKKNHQLYEKYQKKGVIHKIHSIPAPLYQLFQYDAYIDLSGFIMREEFNNQPMMDFYLEAMSIDKETVSRADKRIKLAVDPEINKSITEYLNIFKDNNRKMLLFHPLASTPIRSMPPEVHKRFLQYLLEKTDYMVLSAVKTDFRHERFLDISALSKSLDHFIAIISRMDAVISVDTVTYHVADAYNIPTVVIFSSINPRYRISYYPYVDAVLLGGAQNKIIGVHKAADKNQLIYARQLWDELNFDEVLLRLNNMRNLIREKFDKDKAHQLSGKLAGFQKQLAQNPPKTLAEKMDAIASFTNMFGKKEQSDKKQPGSSQKVKTNNEQNIDIGHDLVSVIMPAFNGEDYISKAIESVFQQSYKDWEIIVVDDASTDNTRKIIQEWARKDKRVKVYYNRKNKGIAQTMNKAILKASGKYLKFLDQDDMLMPECLKFLLIGIKKQPAQVKLIYGDFLAYQSDTQQLNPRLMVQPEPKPKLFTQYLYGNPIVPCTVLLEKAIFNDVGLFDPACEPAQDLDLWFRIMKNYDIAKVNDVVAVYRFHSGQTIKKRSRLRYAVDCCCYKFIKSIDIAAIFPEAKNAAEIAESLDKLVMQMLKRDMTPFDTILELMAYAQHINFSDLREKLYNELKDNLSELLKKKFGADLKLSRKIKAELQADKNNRITDKNFIKQFNNVLATQDYLPQKKSPLKKNYKVKVVIPHFGDDKLLNSCLSALSGTEELQQEDIIIINNNIKNIYFTAAVNEGVKKALDQGAEYIWIINNDTQPESDYLYHSLRRFEQSPNAGIVGGKNLDMNNPDKIFWGGSVGSKHKMGFVSKNDLNEPTLEPWATFSSVVIKAEVFKEAGLLDPNLRILCSDADFCMRARTFGFEVWYEPRSVILHKIGISGRGTENMNLLKIMQEDAEYQRKKWHCGDLHNELLLTSQTSASTNKNLHVNGVQQVLGSNGQAEYLIVAPSYTSASGGIKALHLLCHHLNQSGQKAFLVMDNPLAVNPNLQTPALSKLEIAQKIQQGAIAVYPEIVPGNPLNAQTVIRYVLNRPGVMGGDLTYAESDMIFVYTKMLRQSLGNKAKGVLFIPTIEQDIFFRNEAQARNKQCFYIGKGRYREDIINPLETDMIKITRNPRFPGTREELADLFRQCSMFYCFDNLTIMYYESALCGCPVVLIPDGNYNKEQYENNELGRYGIAFGNSPEEIKFARETVHLAKENYDKCVADFRKNLENFISLSQQKALAGIYIPK